MQQSERDKLITENMKLVYFTLKTYFPTYIHDEDLIQCGMIGLIKAVDNYNPELSKFSYYAVKCIKREMQSEFRRRNLQGKTLSLDSMVRKADGTTTFGDLITGELDVPYVDLGEFIKQLTPVEKEHFDLLNDGYTQSEIPSITGHSHQNVSAIIRRLKLKWRKYVDGNYN